MNSRDSRAPETAPSSLVRHEYPTAALSASGTELTPTTGQAGTLMLANGRTVSVELLAPLLQHIAQHNNFLRISRGLEYRVYTSPALDGAVIKLAAKPPGSDQLIMHPIRPTHAEAAPIAEALARDELAVPFVRVPLTIPVKSVRTGMIREEAVELIVQRKVLTIDRRWHNERDDSGCVSTIARDLASFHKRLITAGYLDADLNCVKNIGYDRLDQPAPSPKLIDLGFVYRLPTDRGARTAALSSYGDDTHTTLGEFLAGSIFDRFYSKAEIDKRVLPVFVELVRELFPGLKTEEMNTLHRAYVTINAEIRLKPRSERMRAYIEHLRLPKNAELIHGALAKLCS